MKIEINGKDFRKITKPEFLYLVAMSEKLAMRLGVEENLVHLTNFEIMKNPEEDD